MHPDPGAIHERAEEHRPAAISLPHSQNVEVVFHKPLVDSVEMQIGRYDLVIIEQKDELSFCRVDCCIASNADAHIVLLKINHFAVFGGLGILAREPMFRQTIVNDHNLGFAELLSKRLDESMAGPRPMNGLNAKGNVLNGDCCFHVSPRVKEFASKFDGMAIVFETLRAAFNVHDRVQWRDVAVERDERVIEGPLKVLCGAAMTSRITSSGGEQAIRVDARRPPEPSGSPRFQGRLREPPHHRQKLASPHRIDWDQAKCLNRLLPNRSHAIEVRRADNEVSMSNLGKYVFHGCHPNFLNSGFTWAIAESISSAVGSMPRNAIIH